MPENIVVNYVHPDGNKEPKEVITAYKTANGVEYIASDTKRVDESGNKIVGVSYKPINADRYEKIVNMEDWKIAKGLMVDDLKDKKDTFEYMIPQEEVLVTEDYEREIALRDENAKKLIVNFQEYVAQHKKAEATPEINPFATQEIVAPQVTETQQEVASVETPINNNSILEFPNIQNNNQVETPQIVTGPNIASVTEENRTSIQNEATQTIVQPEQKIMQAPQAKTTPESSNVMQYYIDTINSLIREISEINAKYQDINAKCQEMNAKCQEIGNRVQNTMTEMGSKVVSVLGEISERDRISIQRFDQSQALLASQNEEVTRDLSKVA